MASKSAASGSGSKPTKGDAVKPAPAVAPLKGKAGKGKGGKGGKSC